MTIRSAVWRDTSGAAALALALLGPSAMAAPLDATMQPLSRAAKPATVANVSCPNSGVSEDQESGCDWPAARAPQRTAPDYPAVRREAMDPADDPTNVGRTDTPAGGVGVLAPGGLLGGVR